MKTTRLLLFLLIPMLSAGQQIKEQDTTFFKIDYGFKYERTEISVGKDTLLIKIYKDKNGTQVAKVSERLSKRVKDSIRRVLIARKTRRYGDNR